MLLSMFELVNSCCTASSPSSPLNCVSIEFCFKRPFKYFHFCQPLYHNQFQHSCESTEIEKVCYVCVCVCICACVCVITVTLIIIITTAAQLRFEITFQLSYF